MEMIKSALVVCLCSLMVTSLTLSDQVAKPRSVPAKADRVIFALETGSCWGESTERRTIEIGKEGVVIKGKSTSASRSLDWWEKTRVMLNEGIVASRPKPANGDCYVPNWICGFEIQIFADKKKKVISGCCNGSKKASKVREAFRRLKPGGPLGPDREPVE
jgi:hypothetical protein